MSPRLVALALRAIAHGAPEPRYEPGGMGHALPGEVEVGGLVYERVVVDGVPRLLPVLKHWSWLGWVLCEVRRRGYLFEFCALGIGDWHRISVCKFTDKDVHPRNERTRETAIVTMLELAHPRSTP